VGTVRFGQSLLYSSSSFTSPRADLARRYGPKLGMRTLDTLRVACALELKAERFWTFDERQAKLAKAGGLKTSKWYASILYSIML
jgi:predicted nucleic acid-binding protein